LAAIESRQKRPKRPFNKFFGPARRIWLQPEHRGETVTIGDYAVTYSNPTFQALKRDWPTVIAALRHYRDYLTSIKEPDEEKDLLIYDQIENLDRIIPSFEKQPAESLKQPALAHKSRAVSRATGF
jgi:hypothetical protein